MTPPGRRTHRLRLRPDRCKEAPFTLDLAPDGSQVAIPAADPLGN